MLTGALPFVADEPLALLNMHRHARPPAVAELQPDAPPDLAALAGQRSGGPGPTAGRRERPAGRPQRRAPTILVALRTAVTRVVPPPVP
jgi:hypothetical protein